MATIAFRVPAVPVAQPRQRHRIIKTGDRMIATNYTPKAAPVNAFKASVQHAAAAAYDRAPIDGPIGLIVNFVFPRPKSMVWKTKPMPRALHYGKPDVDNLLKSLTDAMKGIVFVDDARIWSVLALKYIAAGDEQPHCQITITYDEANGTP